MCIINRNNQNKLISLIKKALGRDIYLLSSSLRKERSENVESFLRYIDDIREYDVIYYTRVNIDCGIQFIDHFCWFVILTISITILIVSQTIEYRSWHNHL